MQKRNETEIKGFTDFEVIEGRVSNTPVLLLIVKEPYDPAVDVDRVGTRLKVVH